LRKTSDLVSLLQEKIAEAIASEKQEGSVTTTTEHWKITCTRKLNRRVIEEDLENALNQLPQPLVNRLIHWKPALDLKEWKYIQSNEPQYADLLSNNIETRPARPYVTVKPAGE
jgi:hypothetical protein